MFGVLYLVFGDRSELVLTFSQNTKPPLTKHHPRIKKSPSAITLGDLPSLPM
jgi:hypothetical protein